MNELRGDIFDLLDEVSHVDALCITTNTIIKPNGNLVMGAGIAKTFALKYPHIPEDWGYRVQKNKDRYGENSSCVLVNAMDSFSKFDNLVSLPTKYHFKDPSDIQLIIKSIKQLIVIANALEWNRIYLPRPGCDLGGLSWDNVVKPSINKFLDERFFVFTK
jgi:hypothetical protein